MKLSYLAYALMGLSLVTACNDNDYMELDKGDTELAITTSSSEITLSEASHSTTAVEMQWTSGTNYGSGNRISYTLQLALSGTDFAVPATVVNDGTQVYSWAPTVEKLNSLLINELSVEAGATAVIDARVIASVAGYDAVQMAATSFTVTTYKEVTPTLYLIGDATPGGWDAGNASEMTHTDNGIFTWTGNLTPGSFKFITTLGQFLPSYNNDGSGMLTYRDNDDQPDEKFTVTEAHCYRVDVNLLTLTIEYTQVEGVTPAFDALYFVGNETDWGFRPMTQDPLDPFLFRIGVFFSKGGEFKFGTADGSWENMYKATMANAPYTSTAMEFVKGFDPDNKWFLTDDETNKAYKICVDIRSGAERMMMREFTPYSAMYIVGDATPNGWDLGNATTMTVDPADTNIFTWSGHLNTGEIKFSADKKDDWNGAWFLADTDGKTPTGSVEKVVFIDKSDTAFAGQYLDIAVGGVDMKWKITEAGDYTITLNQLLEEVTFVKR